jgi:hypothetical protein
MLFISMSLIYYLLEEININLFFIFLFIYVALLSRGKVLLYRRKLSLGQCVTSVNCQCTKNFVDVSWG